jgi:hypothetical protein
MGPVSHVRFDGGFDSARRWNCRIFSETIFWTIFFGGVLAVSLPLLALVLLHHCL